MKFEAKGMFAPFTVLTSIITGALFPLLGSLIAFDLQVVDDLFLTGIVLTMIGGFIAHWMLSHSIHDLAHYTIEQRETVSKKTLKNLLILSLVILLAIAIYLSFERGWPVFVFSVIGAIVSLYGEGLLHHESQMAVGAMFLVIGAFYVQAAELFLDPLVWIKVILIALFAFFSQYGWLLFYRLDDYQWDKHMKNRSILITKTGLIFLIIYLFL